MAEHKINLETWIRKEQFNLFRTYQKPHYAVTSRIDITNLMTRAKAQNISTYRACLYAIGAGIQAVPELRTRFRGDDVVVHDKAELSMTVPKADGGYGYAYVPFHQDFNTFDLLCAEIIESVSKGGTLSANTGEKDDLIYLSCLPWFDFTSFNNALPHSDDCIPRVTWGKFINHGDKWDMAMSIEVHHALVDGEHIGQFFAAVAERLVSFA